VLLWAEPTKQKTRRPERRGITRAVSPKKMGKERSVQAQERRRKGGSNSGRRGSKSSPRLKSQMMR
jgi:hypothetical protein